MLSIPGDLDHFHDTLVISPFVTGLKWNRLLRALMGMSDTATILVYNCWQGNSEFHGCTCKDNAVSEN